jgi:hypothetical protein
MSGGGGALIQLVAKGSQDAYLTDSEKGEFPFKTMYARYRNFAHAPKKLTFIGQVQPGGSAILPIPSVGDLLTGVWLEGPVGLSSSLAGSTFELYIGGQLVDSQTTDFISEIWQPFLPENQAKSDTWNNLISTTNDGFFPLHFFFCDNDMFLPILAIQFHPIEIRITWGPNVGGLTLNAYGNFVFLDTKDREEFTKKPLDILITQVQKTIATTSTNIDLSVFNHPVKAFFFGVPLPNTGAPFTFTSADILLNGTYLLEQMSPTYFYTAQVYYHTKHGVTTFDTTSISPLYTQYFMYSFANDASSYRPTGTCNFSRLDNVKVNVVNPTATQLKVYAVNYNVLRIKNGMAGVLFGN